MIKFSVSSAATRKRLQNLSASTVNSTQRVLENGIAAAQAHARATTKFKDTEDKRGKVHLRGSIVGVVGPGQFVTRLIAAASHALYVNGGTKPHDIPASRKPYLVFQVNGHWVSKKVVKHPGTTATHFMEDAVGFVAPRVRDNLDAAMSTNARRFNG